MYLCHSENLMPKDTKSLGNNKAPACESRGFVLKKKKVRILTHLQIFYKYTMLSTYNTYATFSNFFIIEKINRADNRQQTINTLHTIHNCIPPHR